MKLMEEANEEAKHKGWRDTELSTNKQTRKEKSAAIETLHAEFDEPYKGMGGESGGVTGMREVIETDFAGLETDTKAGEATVQKDDDESSDCFEILAMSKKIAVGIDLGFLHSCVGVWKNDGVEVIANDQGNGVHKLETCRGFSSVASVTYRLLRSFYLVQPTLSIASCCGDAHALTCVTWLY